MKLPSTIPQKANRVLKVILIVMVLVLVRVWQVSIVQHSEKQDQARHFQTRTQAIKPQRGVIEDRFGEALATNAIQYNAAITYAPIREIPRVVGRKKSKKFLRKTHIENLSKLLGEELGRDPGRIEDLIHSKASLFPNIPYVIGSNITEEQYFRLKMLEREWPGLTAERASCRSYPLGKVGAEVVGYVGPISREEYLRVADEIRALKGYIEGYERGDPVLLPKGIASIKEASIRLNQLQERTYSLQDAVGKGGVEKAFDEALRGIVGKVIYEQDIYGTYREPLPGSKEPTHGEGVTLALSATLQRKAEELLAQTERYRDGRSHKFDFTNRVYSSLKQPWIKGGAIVVMDPNTGEILTLASYPRCDNNDFILRDPSDKERMSNVLRWFETERHLGEIWDGKRPLERENFSPTSHVFEEEDCPLTLTNYFEFALSKEGGVRKGIERVGTVEEACHLQRTFADFICGKDPQKGVEGFESPYFGKATSYEKLLILDFCKVLVDETRFSPPLLEVCGALSLADYRKLTQAACVMEEMLKNFTKPLFHDHHFSKWRAEHQKAFLKQKRQEEKEQMTYQRPYLDYLDKEEKAQFAIFWKEVKWNLLTLLIKGREACVEIDLSFAPYAEAILTLSDELTSGAYSCEGWHSHYHTLACHLSRFPFSLTCDFFATVRPFAELDRPLWGRYRYLKGKVGAQTEKELASAFYPRYGFGYGRSHAFRQATIQGSVFKFIPAFEALMQRYARFEGRGDLNPLTMVDDVHKVSGKSGQWNVGFTKEGKAISQRYKGGKLLRTHRRHVGKINLTKALETSSNSYFGILAIDCIDNPEDLNRAARSLSFGAKTGIDLPGEFAGCLPDDLSFNRTGLYTYVDGQHTLVVTPLQTAVMLSALVNGGSVFKPQILKGEKEIVRQLEIPGAVHAELLEGMRLVVQGEQGGARPSVIRSYHEAPWILRDYRSLYKQMVGKTSTSESVETVDLDPYTGTNTYNHLWFAGVSFQPDQIDEGPSGVTYGKPELVVIVYLKYGDYGREAAPLAAQMVKEWRKLQKSY